MKTALKLLLVSISFLSVAAFGKSEWVENPGQPGVGRGAGNISHFVVAPDGTIYVTERLSYDGSDCFWKSPDGGKTWFMLRLILSDEVKKKK